LVARLCAERHEDWLVVPTVNGSLSLGARGPVRGAEARIPG
jgi:hypothetical protein